MRGLWPSSTHWPIKAKRKSSPRSSVRTIVTRYPVWKQSTRTTVVPIYPSVVRRARGPVQTEGRLTPVEIAEAFPGKYRSNEDAPSAAEVYRKLLAAEPDHSVVVVTVGYVTNLRDLLATDGDDYNPLNGVALARRKVKRWVCMGGRYPRHLDPGVYGNFKPDPASAVEAARDWPTEIVFSGLGQDIITGMSLRRAPETNPVRQVYDFYLKGKPGRPSWDPITVLYAVRPDEAFWRLHERGYNHIFPNGTNEWRETPDDPRHKLLDLQPQTETKVQSIIEDLIARPPRDASGSTNAN